LSDDDLAEVVQRALLRIVEAMNNGDSSAVDSMAYFLAVFDAVVAEVRAQRADVARGTENVDIPRHAVKSEGVFRAAGTRVAPAGSPVGDAVAAERRMINETHLALAAAQWQVAAAARLLGISTRALQKRIESHADSFYQIPREKPGRTRNAKRDLVMPVREIDADSLEYWIFSGGDSGEPEPTTTAGPVARRPGARPLVIDVDFLVPASVDNSGAPKRGGRRPGAGRPRKR
jgi:hypothetical protein